MGSRWFGTLHGAKHVRQRQEGSVFNEAKAVMPPAATNSWRSWLSSGTRRAPIDRRRARGAEAQLKKIEEHPRPFLAPHRQGEQEINEIKRAANRQEAGHQIEQE